MAKKYSEIEHILWEQHNIAQAIHNKMKKNGGEYEI